MIGSDLLVIGVVTKILSKAIWFLYGGAKGKSDISHLVQVESNAEPDDKGVVPANIKDSINSKIQLI